MHHAREDQARSRRVLGDPAATQEQPPVMRSDLLDALPREVEIVGVHRGDQAAAARGAGSQINERDLVDLLLEQVWSVVQAS